MTSLIINGAKPPLPLMPSWHAATTLPTSLGKRCSGIADIPYLVCDMVKEKRLPVKLLMGIMLVILVYSKAQVVISQKAVRGIPTAVRTWHLTNGAVIRNHVILHFYREYP